MKGAFVANRYYSDNGTRHTLQSLSKAFGSVSLVRQSPTLIYNGQIDKEQFDFDFAVFWDKDFYLASAIKKCGIPVFNSPEVLAVCDDKQKTYAALTGIDIPKTISAPLMYDVNDETDTQFLAQVADTLGFPVIVKENTGSQGRQVYKADTMQDLQRLYMGLRHTPHHYQQLVGEFGCDLRIYTVGGKAVAACKRQGIDFKSNLGAGGSITLVDPQPQYLRTAEDISRQLSLDFGAVDFLITDKPVFLEVNSNAYFTGIEGLGVDIARPIAEYILQKVGIKETGKNAGGTTTCEKNSGGKTTCEKNMGGTAGAKS